MKLKGTSRTDCARARSEMVGKHVRLNWNSNKKAKNLQMRAVTFRIRFSMGPMSLGPILNLNTNEFQCLSALARDRNFKNMGPMGVGTYTKA